MEIYLYLILFLFGLVIGSFINALAYRIENKISILGRSFCPNCKKVVKWYDLFPVFSYISLFGKCRNCKKKISAQYPIVEFLTGLAMVIYIYFFFGKNIAELIYSFDIFNAVRIILGFFIVGILVLIAAYDYKTGYILSGYLYFALALVLIDKILYFRFLSFSSYSQFILSALGAAAFFGVLYLISKGRWMGAGDIEVALILGLVLGFPGVLIALYFAFIVGSIFGIVKILYKKSTLKSEMSFGPFLISGIFFALLFTEQIVSLYARMFIGY